MSPPILITLIQFNFPIKMLLSPWTFGLLAFSFPAVSLTNSHCLSAFPSCSISIISPVCFVCTEDSPPLPTKGAEFTEKSRSQTQQMAPGNFIKASTSCKSRHGKDAKTLFLNVHPRAQRSLAMWKLKQKSKGEKKGECHPHVSLWPGFVQLIKSMPIPQSLHIFVGFDLECIVT